MNSVVKILRTAEDIEYWKKLVPSCNITDTPFSGGLPDYEVTAEQRDSITCSVLEEGYFNLEPVLSTADIKLIVDAIQAIIAVGLPPVFCFVFDEVWQVFARLNQVIEPILKPGFKFKTAGIWAWFIDNKGSGFPPHRDLLERNIELDGSLSNLTVWIPFTDATPLNGCMYVLPASMDPDFPDNLKGGTRIDVQCARALPAKAGSVLGWSSNIIHWGARSSHLATVPRISIGVGYHRADYYERSWRANRDHSLGAEFNFERYTEVPFKDRLDFIGQAIWIYKQRVAGLYPGIAATLFDYCRKHYVSPGQPAAVDAMATDIIIRERKRLVNKLREAGEHTEVREMLKQLCTDYPTDADAWQLRGWQEGSLGQLDMAEICFRKAIDLQGDLLEARKGLAKVLSMKSSNNLS